MESFRVYGDLSPRGDTQNPGCHQAPSLSSHNYPSRDEIIARLSQVREYTEKAEQALHALPSEASDAKFRQLQEMTAEMRTTERRLMDALREYDTEDHGSSSRVSLERVILRSIDMSRRASSVFLDEANDRSQSEFKGQLSAITVRNSEDEKGSFLRSRTQETTGRLENVKTDSVSPRAPKERDSAGRILLSEDLVQAQLREGACGATSEKGYDIHGIIAEIALIRRAKDESARKLDELQFAIDTEVLKKAGVSYEASPKLPEVERQNPIGTARIAEGSSIRNESMRESDADLGFLDAYDDAISRKLNEIHVMREKLDAMQRMINLPTPRTSTALDEEVAMVSSNALTTDSSKEIIDTVPIQKPCPQLPVRHTENTDLGSRALYKEEHSPTGFVPYNPNSSKVDVRKAMSVPFSGIDLGALRVTPGRNSVSPMKGSRKVNGSGFQPFVPLRDQFSSQGQQPTCDTSEEQRQYASSSHRMENNFGDVIADDWMAYDRHPNPRQMAHDHIERLSNLETYVAESNILLKHICSSISTINSQLNDHKRQLHSIQDTVEKVYYGSHVHPVNETSSYRRSSSHGRLAPDRDRKDFLLNLNPPLAKNHYFPTNDLTRTGRQSQDYSMGDFNRRSNSSKDANPPWDALGAFGGPSFYTEQPHHSEYYGRHQDVMNSKTQPWVSPPMDNGSSMLNNQIPPGNRTNNYWDNFRSQSRQNVFSSSGKSDSYNRTSTLSPEAMQSQIFVNNVASPHQRYDRHTNARPIRGASHFVENIGSKNRNQEQQSRMAPQRSVSVGSMLSMNDRMTRERSAFILGRHLDEEQPIPLRNNSVLNTDRPHNRVPGGQRNFNEPSQGDYANYDLVDEICARLGQLRSDNIRQKTLDVVRSFVDQSVLEDQRVRSQDVQPDRRRGNTEPPETSHSDFMELASTRDLPRNISHSEIATRLTDVQESESAIELRNMQDFMSESLYEASNVRRSASTKRESSANPNQLEGKTSQQNRNIDAGETHQGSMQQEAPTGDSRRVWEESATRSTFRDHVDRDREEDNVFNVTSTRSFENSGTGSEREQRLDLLRSLGGRSVSSSLFTEAEDTSRRTRLDGSEFEQSAMWSRDVTSTSDNGHDHRASGSTLPPEDRTNSSLESP